MTAIVPRRIVDIEDREGHFLMHVKLTTGWKLHLNGTPEPTVQTETFQFDNKQDRDNARTEFLSIDLKASLSFIKTIA